MLVFVASLIPSAGYSGFARIIPLVLGVLFQNTGIDDDLESIVESAPCRDKLRNFLLRMTSIQYC